MSGEWIPVTERLPERGVPVIGWFPGATQSFECSLNEHDGVWCDWGTGIYLYDDERPTHWMPFPDGPTGAAHMNDALEEIARLTALVESLRREVRTQRLEIAGLREERRALLEADRPQPDRPEAIATGESDRPEPINDARLAALQRLADLDEELGLPRACAETGET